MLRAASTFLIAVLLALPAIARDDKAAQYYEDGARRLEKGDVAGAIIQLKNALQQDSKMLSAHILIGKAYLEDLHPVAAQESLESSLRLGADRSQVALMLAQALLGQSKSSELLERLPPEAAAPGDRAELLVLRAEAHEQLRQFPQAAESLRQALVLEPRRLSALLAMSKLLLRQGKLDEAGRYADQALAVGPENARAWYVRGTVYHAAGRNVTEALKAYAKALDTQPNLVDARVARIGLNLDTGYEEAAVADLEYLARESPQEPRAAYFRAVLASRKGDGDSARAALAKITEFLDPVPVEIIRARAAELLMIGGLAHHGLGEPEKAQRYFEQFLLVDPLNPGARKLLASIHIGRKDYNRAIDVLEAGRRAAGPDPQLLSLLASAYMGAGKDQIAMRLLEEAMQVGGSTPDVNASLGFNLLRGGNEELAVNYLRKAFDKDPSMGNAGVTLVTTYLRRGEPRQALAVAEQAAKYLPRNPAAQNLLGSVRMRVGDIRGARAAFDQALALAPAFAPAKLNLAKIDVAEGKFDEARGRLSGMLKVQPKDGQALYEMARVDLAARDTEGAVRWLEKLRSLEPSNVRAAMLQSEIYLQGGQFGNALEAARAAMAAAPESMEVQAAVIRALIATRDTKGARTMLTQMTRSRVLDPGQRYLVAGLQLQAGDREGAASNLEKAVADRPDFVEARAALADIELGNGRFDRAEARARALQKDKPASGEGPRLLGDVAAARGNRAEALKWYRNALTAEPSASNLLRVFGAYVNTGDLQSGLGLLEGWLKERPDDVVVRRALGEGQMRAGRWKDARTTYSRLLAHTKDDPMLLNNLAVTEDRLGNQQKALEYAERARALAPGDPMVLDTMGWLLVRKGDVEVGIKHLREAKVRAPGIPVIRYHLAEALSRAGRRGDARAELAGVDLEAANFDDVDQARILFVELGGK